MHQGSCMCQGVRYQFSGEPLTCYACHCTDCQTTTGSAFAMSMIVNENDLKVIDGDLEVKTNPVNGIDVRCHQCRQCGVALWYSADEYPGIVALKPGSFDDTKWFKPVAHLWVRSAQPWVNFDESTKKYQKQPEITELFELWNNRDK